MKHNLDNKRREIQQQAFNAWVESGYKGFVLAVTGIGKSWIIYDAIGIMKKGSNILLLSETHKRDDQLLSEVALYNQLTGNNVSMDNVILETYQKMYKSSGEHYDLVIADEADFIGMSYKEFFDNNTYDKVLLLSATKSESVKYYENEMDTHNFTTKGEILDNIAPTVFEYTVKSGLKDKVSRNLNIFIIEHELDDEHETVKSPFSDKLYTEHKVYRMYNSRIEYIRNLPRSKSSFFAKRKWENGRARFVYGLPSKIPRTKQLLSDLKGRSLVLGKSLDALYQITQYTVSSRNNDKLNKELIENMKNGSINLLAADKMLTRGMNFKDLDNIVIISYNSATHNLLQSIGRMRLKDEFSGNVYIFKTNGTREVDWFDKLIPVLKNYKIHNFNG